MCVFVVGWHTKVLGPTLAGSTPRRDLAALTWSDLAYFNGLLVAVPCFLVMSAWLLYERATGRYVRERLVWLLTVYAFWSLAYSTYTRASLACDPRSVRCIGYTLLTGNGTAANYYFAAQIVCDLALFALVRLPSTAGTTAAIALIVVSAANAVVTQIGPWAAAGSWFYSPLNFLVAPALVFLIRRHAWTLTTGRARLVLAAGALGLTAVEYALYAHGPWRLPAYARLSIFATALLLLSLALSAGRTSPGWLARLAVATLGVFAVHFFVMDLVGVTPAPAFGLARLGQLATVLVVAFLVAEGLRFAFRQRLV